MRACQTLRATRPLILVFLGVSSVPGIAGVPKASFSSNYTSAQIMPNGKSMKMSGQLWVRDGKIRRETIFEGHVMDLIIDTNSHKTLSLVPDQGFYEDVSNKLAAMSAMPGGPGDFNFFVANTRNPCSAMKNTQCSSERSDSVGGRTCQVWSFKTPTGAEWSECIDGHLPIALRTERAGRTIELTGIKEGAQSARLFRPPPELKLVVLKGEL